MIGVEEEGGDHDNDNNNDNNYKRTCVVGVLHTNVNFHRKFQYISSWCEFGYF